MLSGHRSIRKHTHNQGKQRLSSFCHLVVVTNTIMSALTLGRVFVSVRSFIAESEQLREQWVDAMRDAIGEALSNSEVAERIWAEPSNSLCADCGAPKPEWAAINLCVVICKRCAGLCLCVWLWICVYKCFCVFLVSF